MTDPTDSGDFFTGNGSGNSGDLRYCMAQAQASANAVVRIQCDPVLTRDQLPWISTVPNPTLTIQSDGGQRTIDGQNLCRPFFFDTPGANIVVRDLRIIRGRAKGGDGGFRGLGGGGGGAGLGGAIFLATGALTLQNMVFDGNLAIGGAGGGEGPGGGGGLGGIGGDRDELGGGGGGGYLGAGGYALRVSFSQPHGGGGGGGGLVGNGGSTNSFDGGGGGGTTDAPGGTGAGMGGGAGGAAFSEDGLLSGKDGVTRFGGGGGGGVFGIIGSLGYTPGDGGHGQTYGGGGGAGGGSTDGQFVIPCRGGNGGDYGGGGGAASDGQPSQYSPGFYVAGGNGGFGGGGGGVRRGLMPAFGGSGGFGGGNGSGIAIAGNGSGFGGAVFLRAGATLALESVTFSNGGIFRGSGRNAGGASEGRAVFAMSGDVVLNFAAGSNSTLTDGFGGGCRLVLNGPATSSVTLQDANTTGVIAVAGGLRVDAGHGSALSAQNSLVFDGGWVRLVGFVPYFPPVSVTAGNAIRLDTNGQNVSFPSVVSGPGPLIKVGTGTLTLVAANTYTGNTSVEGGTLVAGRSGAPDATFKRGTTVTVAAGATLVCNGTDSLGYYDGAVKVVVDGGTLTTEDVTGQHTTIQDLTMTGGLLTSPAADGAFLINGPFNTLASSNTAVINSPFFETVGGYSAPTVFTVAAGSTPSGVDLLIDAVVRREGPVNKQGPGVLRLTKSNLYQGGTTVGGGVLEIANAGALASGNVVFSGGTLRLLGVAPADLSPRISTTGGGSVRLDTNGQDQTFGTAIGGSGGLVKLGAGTLTLNAANTYAGDTQVLGGTLVAGRNGQQNGTFAAGTNVVVGSGGTLVCTGTDSLGYFQGYANLVVNGGTVTTDGASGQHTTLQQATMSGGLIMSPAADGTFLLNGSFLTKASPSLALVRPPFLQLATLVSGGVDVFDVEREPANLVDLELDTVVQNFTGNGLIATLEKRGAGIMLLRKSNTYTGPTVINGGTLALGNAGSLGPSGSIAIGSGAKLDASALGGAGFFLASGRTLINNGAILGVLAVSGTFAGNGALGGLTVNSGAVVARSSGTLAIAGNITNNGTMRFTGGAVLDAGGAGSFVNNGLLDLITAGPGTTLPANFTNGVNGVVLTAGTVRITSTSKSGSNVSVTIDGYAAHTYQLQRSSSLASSTFVNIGSPQSGTGVNAGVPLVFSDPAASAAASFYRVVVQ